MRRLYFVVFLLTGVSLWAWPQGTPGQRFSVQPAAVSGCPGPVTVSAGAASTLNLPATDLSLWGSVTSAANYPNTPSATPLAFTWALVSGPAAVTFSAPWDTTTTVSFTQTGTYTVSLTGTDGVTTPCVSTTTVTVNPASSQTAFYVDPTSTAGSPNGSAAHPWTALFDSDSDFTTKWSTITTALATNDVIIYFSARLPGSDVSESVTGVSLMINRRCRMRPTGMNLGYCPSVDTSSHHLTVDGMSLYSTSDSAPTWVTNPGTHKFKLSNCVSSLCIGWGDSLRRDHVTVRGFESTGSDSRQSFSGSDFTWEYNWIHDQTGTGPQFLLDNGMTDYPGCIVIGSANNVTVRKNLLTTGVGEAIYIGGTYFTTAYGGCPPPTYNPPTNSGLLVEANTIDHSNSNGGGGDEGACTDMKAGWIHVTNRANVCTNSVRVMEAGFSWNGQFSDAPEDYLWENNTVTGAGMSAASCFLGVMTNGIIIRNNLLANNTGGYGIYLIKSAPGGGTQSTVPMHNIRIYNNTFYNNNQGAVVIGGDGTVAVDSVTLRDNLFFGNGAGNQLIQGNSPVTNLSSDYNLLAPAGSDFTEGPHSIIQTSKSGIVVSTSTPDFHLVSGSPAILKGLSLAAMFNIDIAGRPRGAAWDIGAYQFSTTTAQPPGAPTNLKIVQ
jgi:hypothetical protein